MTHSTVSPHRSVDATGRALPMTVEEIHARSVEVATGLAALDDMGDEEEQRQTLSAHEGQSTRNPCPLRQELPGKRLVFLDSGPLGLLTNPRGRKSTYLKHDLLLGTTGASPYERFVPFERQGTVAKYVAVRNWGSRSRT